MTYPVGDIRNCQLSVNNGPQYRMGVLPGGGFDNLRNLDMGQVHARNYSLCQISPDGKYLLPDNVFLNPLEESNINYFSELFDHWDKYTDLTSSSINVDASFASINGKFSAGYRNMKTLQYKYKAHTTRTQVRHRLYTLNIQPGSQLHPAFKSSVFEIAANIQNNNTEYANYLAQLLVRDYGTHFTTSVDAGAVLAKVDYFRSTYSTESVDKKASIAASAGGSFFNYNLSFGISFKFESGSTKEHNYFDEVVYSEVISHGGPPVPPTGFSMEDWEKSVPNALVAVDRAGKPLHYAINRVTLPDLPPITVFRVSEMVEQAVNCYYRANSIEGCTSPDAPNFNFQANLAEQSTCKESSINFTFGGAFQKCFNTNFETIDLCTEGLHPKAVRNDLTGDFSCPPGYVMVKLYEGHASQTDTVPECHESCTLGFFCEDNCMQVNKLNLVKYSTYWCAESASVHADSGYLFGGFYTALSVNPVTGSKGCPRFFHPVRILGDTVVCVSSDIELGARYAVEFGGFFSCSAGNPLAAYNGSIRWPHRCPLGHAQHLVTVHESCEIYFCVKMGTFKSVSLTPAKSPPFGRKPDFKPNVTETLAVSGLYGQLWVQDERGVWVEREGGSEDGNAFLETLRQQRQRKLQQQQQGSNGGISTAGVVFLTMFLTAATTLIIVGGIAVYCKCCRK